MPYRTPDRPVEPPEASKELDLDFWRESNGVNENRALIAADNLIVPALKHLMLQWYRVTKIKYPKDYHVILHDLRLASLGRSGFIRLAEKPKNIVGVLVELANMDGLLEVEPELFDLSTADADEMAKYLKESIVRWVKVEPQIRRALEHAFEQTAGKLGEYLLDKYSDEYPDEVMSGVYFRAAAQYDLSMFQSSALVRNLYLYIFD